MKELALKIWNDAHLMLGILGTGLATALASWPGEAPVWIKITAPSIIAVGALWKSEVVTIGKRNGN
jgi:hypothetical protein